MNVEFGIGLPRLDSIAESAQRAEALGYDFLSTGEHVFFHGPIGNGLISLAAAAGATTRIKLMSSITLVPLYPAALLYGLSRIKYCLKLVEIGTVGQLLGRRPRDLVVTEFGESGHLVHAAPGQAEHLDADT